MLRVTRLLASHQQRQVRGHLLESIAAVQGPCVKLLKSVVVPLGNDHRCSVIVLEKGGLPSRCIANMAPCIDTRCTYCKPCRKATCATPGTTAQSEQLLARILLVPHHADVAATAFLASARRRPRTPRGSLPASSGYPASPIQRVQFSMGQRRTCAERDAIRSGSRSPQQGYSNCTNHIMRMYTCNHSDTPRRGLLHASPDAS